MSLKFPNLKDHIFEYPLLTEDECDQIVSTLDEENGWKDFMWYGSDYHQVDID